jgi:hypothetical protein
MEVAAQCGVANLARRINAILGQHIRSLLPQLRTQVGIRWRPQPRSRMALGLGFRFRFSLGFCLN